jgi:hypothetical protein
VNVWTVPLYLAATEVGVVALLPGVLLVGALGVAGVVAIGSALIALGTRRARQSEPEPAEEVIEAVRP